MEVGTLKHLSTQQSYSSIGNNQSNNAEVNEVSNETASEQGSSTEKIKEEKPLDKKELSELTSEMNKFLELVNSDIQFVLHEKTQRLMVRVVDVRENKVLKEFPPHEMLDTLAKIRDYVGLLLDKKA